jgi:single-strand DNA-binding protein
MASLNFAIIMGRLTTTPELKHTANDMAFTRFSVAVDRVPSKSSDKEKQTDFFNIVAFGNNADFICKYFKKGSLIIIEARMQTGSFEGSDGIKRQTFDLVVNRVHFAGPKSQGDSNFSGNSFSGNSFSSGASFSSDESNSLENDDDDLPF